MFPKLKKTAYFMHGFMAHLPEPVTETARRMLDLSPVNHVSEKYLQGMLSINESRRLFASLVGADPNEVAITHNTTEGVNIAAEIIDIPKGSNVIVSEIEHPCSTYPWIARRDKGIELRYVPTVADNVSIDAIERHMDRNTKVVHLSHVSHLTGRRYNLGSLGKLARENGAYLIIDASQSAGIMDLRLDQLEVDFLATCGYKWLLGPVGTGFLYIRKELCEKFNPPHPGWRTSTNPLALNPARLAPPENATKFEMGGMPNIIGLDAMNQGMKLISDFGIELAERVVLDLCGYCLEQFQQLGLKIISPIAIEERSSLVVIELDDADAARKYLAEKNILVSGTSSEHFLRIDLHFFNTEKEIDRLANALAEHLSIPGKQRKGWFNF